MLQKTKKSEPHDVFEIFILIGFKNSDWLF